MRPYEYMVQSKIMTFDQLPRYFKEQFQSILSKRMTTWKTSKITFSCVQGESSKHKSQAEMLWRWTLQSPGSGFPKKTQKSI